MKTMLPARLWMRLRLIRDAHLLLLFSLHTTITSSLPANDTVLEECAKSRTAADFVVCLNRTMPANTRLKKESIFKTIEGFTCKGKCGTQTLACSCRPACVPARSCCDDFLQECPKKVQRLNDGLQWLRHVNMTCTPGKVYIVSSCPVPGSTLSKLLRDASNPSAQPNSEQPAAFSASDCNPLDATTVRGTDVVPTDETARFRSLNMSYTGDDGAGAGCNHTRIGSTGESTGSSKARGTTIKPGTQFKRLTTAKEKKHDDRGSFSNGEEFNAGRTRDFQGGSPLPGNKGVNLRKPDDAGESMPSDEDEFRHKISVDFKQAYANAPVTDVNTGLIFANSSIFDCYSSVTGDEIYWEADLPFPGGVRHNLTMAEMLKLYTGEVRHPLLNYIPPLDAEPLHERCMDRMRDQCPENSVLGPGCARSTGYINSDTFIFYRNPFCSVCSELNWASTMYVSPSIWHVSRGGPEFRITMIPEWNRVRFVGSFNPNWYYSLTPLWKEITCEESDTPRMTSIGNDVMYPNGSQTCRAGVFLKYGKCYVETVFVIKLPHYPGKSNMGDLKNIPKCLMIFNKEIVEASTSVIPIDQDPRWSILSA